ncbi:DMT family transporter [Paenibacillus marinisediminis]
MSKSNLWLGALLSFFAAAAWGAMFPVAENALKHIDPFWFSSLRYGTVALLLCIILLVKEGRRAFRFEGRGFKLWIFGTFAFTVYNFFVFWGQQQMGKSGVLLASIMESFMPMLVILLMWVITRKPPKLATLACVIVAFIGVIFVVTKGDFSLFTSSEFEAIPLLSVFIGVVGWVFYSVGSGQFRGWSALRYSTLTCILGSATSVIITGGMTISGSLSVPTMTQLQPIIPHMLFMIVIAGLAALLAWMRGMELLSPENGMLFINFVPATTFFISVLQGYQVSAAEWFGTTLILIALVVNNMLNRRTSQASARVQKAVKAASVTSTVH